LFFINFLIFKPKIDSYFNENSPSSLLKDVKDDTIAAENSDHILESSTLNFEDDFVPNEEPAFEKPIVVVEENKETPVRVEKKEPETSTIPTGSVPLNYPETKPAFNQNPPPAELKPIAILNNPASSSTSSFGRYNPAPRVSNAALPVEPVISKLSQSEESKVPQKAVYTTAPIETSIPSSPLKNNNYILTETVTTTTEKKNEYSEEYTLIQQREINMDQAAAKKDENLTRVCRLIRTANNELYGFDLKTFPVDGRHIAKNIQKNSPADRAGLMDGDIILEINGDSIDGLDKNQVIGLIRMFPRQVDLLVIYYKNIGRLNEVGLARLKAAAANVSAPPATVQLKHREIPRYRKNSAFSAVDKRARAASTVMSSKDGIYGRFQIF
jgi:hypothetical protein